jgi:hypothetical protein
MYVCVRTIFAQYSLFFLFLVWPVLSIIFSVVPYWCLLCKMCISKAEYSVLFQICPFVRQMFWQNDSGTSYETEFNQGPWSWETPADEVLHLQWRKLPQHTECLSLSPEVEHEALRKAMVLLRFQPVVVMGESQEEFITVQPYIANLIQMVNSRIWVLGKRE